MLTTKVTSLLLAQPGMCERMRNEMEGQMSEMQAARKAAEAAGYYIREGSYQGATDDRLGRWYVGREGEVFRPHGAGYRTQGEAWRAAADAAAEMAQWEG